MKAILQYTSPTSKLTGADGLAKLVKRQTTVREVSGSSLRLDQH